MNKTTFSSHILNNANNKKELNKLTYYISGLQNSVCNMLEREKDIKKLSNLQLGKKLNISVARVKQILDGEYDGKVSQLIEIALKLGYTPEFKFNHPIFSETK